VQDLLAKMLANITASQWPPGAHVPVAGRRQDDGRAIASLAKAFTTRQMPRDGRMGNANCSAATASQLNYKRRAILRGMRKPFTSYEGTFQMQKPDSPAKPLPASAHSSSWLRSTLCRNNGGIDEKNKKGIKIHALF